MVGATTTFTIITQKPTITPAFLAEGPSETSEDGSIFSYFIVSDSPEDIAGTFGIDPSNQGLCANYAAGVALYAAEYGPGSIGFEDRTHNNEGTPVLATLNSDNSINLFQPDGRHIHPFLCSGFLFFDGDPDRCLAIELFAVPTSSALTTTTVRTVTSTITVTSTPTCAIANIVKDSGFDYGDLRYWTASGLDSAQDYGVVQPNGETSEYGVNSYSSGRNILSQVVNTTSGADYTISMSIRSDDNSGYSSVKLSAGGQSVTVIPNGDYWQQVTLNVTAPGPNMTVQVVSNFSQAASVYIDNIMAVGPSCSNAAAPVDASPAPTCSLQMPKADSTDNVREGLCAVDVFESKVFVPYSRENSTTTAVDSLNACEVLLTGIGQGGFAAQYDNVAGTCTVYQDPACYQKDLVATSANLVALYNYGCQK